MVSYTQLTGLDIAGLETFAERWSAIHRKLKSARTEFEQDVVEGLRKDNWIGEGGRAAQRYCTRVLGDLDAVDTQVRSLRGLIDKEADGATGRGGVKGLEGHQKAVLEYARQAMEKGMTVNSKGEVSWAEFGAPGTPTKEERQRHEQKDKDAAALQTKIQKELAQATETDQQLSRELKVIFGTTDNFRTEDRRYATESPGLHDRWVEMQLMSVAAGMATVKGWDNAAAMLRHYLDGSGSPYTVNPQTMLDDIPSFRSGVNGALANARRGPDGRFDTGWQTGQAQHTESMDWYYALHHFEYRVVGEKHDGKITYHVEVRKQYDWGVPSEHRRDVDGVGGAIHLEQADIARLHMTGLARDFPVRGRSPEMTAPG